MLKSFIKSLLVGLGFALGLVVIFGIERGVSEYLARKTHFGWTKVFEAIEVSLDKVEEGSDGIWLSFSITNNSDQRIGIPIVEYEIYDQSDELVLEGTFDATAPLPAGKTELGIVKLEDNPRIPSSDQRRIILKIVRTRG